MAASAPGRLFREIKILVGEADFEGLPDGQLLDRFAQYRDESAFEVLVRRYGRLVLGVCRRVLRDPHTAEDAFQATFLVLVHKAGSLDRQRPIADWLYTVAFRLACRARLNASRRQQRELSAPRAHVAEPPSIDDTAAILHEELNRLPERHRTPLVLAYLEGRTYEQVSQALGCPLGSVGSRLSQAMQALQGRLTSRGVVAPAGVAALMTASAASGAVPAPLIDTTVRAGLWFVGEQVVGAAASTAAVQLARGALGTMTTYKLAVAAGLLVVIGVCGGTAWVARSTAMPDTPKSVVKATDAAPTKADLPEGAISRMGSSQFRHGEAVFFIAYTPDDKHIVTAGRDHAIKLWDRATGKAVRGFELVPKKPAIAPKAMPADTPMPGKMMMMRNPVAEDFPLALSHDGKHLVASRGETITVWDVATGKTLHELTTKSNVFELAFTPDGTLIASDAGRDVTLWDVANGKLVKTFKVPAPEEAAGTLRTGAAVSPAGTHIAQQFIDGAAGNAVLRIIDLATGKAEEEIKMGVGGAQAIAFSPDGKYLAWSAFTDGVVVWDVAAHKQLTTFAKNEGKPRFFGNSICFTDDGKTLAVTLANDAIELWDVAGAKLLRTIGGHETPRSNRVAVRLVVGASDRMTRSDLAFSTDGKTIGGSLGNATVRQYDTETGNEISPSAGHLSGVIAVGSDGRTAVSVSKESVRVWDASGREVRHWALTPPAISASVSPDGKRVATATGGGALQLWDTMTGKLARTIETKRADVAGLGFSPDGKVIATKAELNSAVNLWDAATGDHLRTIGQDGEPVINGGRVSIDGAGAQTPAVVFSPDGLVIAAVGDRKQVGFWDVASGVSLGEIATSAVAFAFSTNGHVLAVLSNRGVVTGYEVATGEKRYEFKPSVDIPAPIHGTPGGGAFSITAFTRGNASAGGIGFSADGRFVVAGTSGPMLRVWDTLTGQEVTQLKGHQGSVSVVRTAPDGRSLISGSIDTTAMAWNLDHLPRLDLTRDAPMPGADLESLWADLAKPDPVAAATATRKLLTERTQAVTLLKERLRPVPSVDDARIAKLIADLGGSFDARRKSTAELEHLGGLAAEPLRAALAKNPALDLKQRIEKLLEKATVQKPAGDRLRELRAVEVLELAATSDAKQVLESLAKGAPGARLTREAQAAAARMGDQPMK